jgi:hypothetical protein
MLSSEDRVKHIEERFIEYGFSEAMKILENASLEVEVNISTVFKQLLGIFIEENLILLCRSDEVNFTKLCEDGVKEQLQMVTDYKSSTNGRIGIQAFLLEYDPNDKEWTNWQPNIRDHKRIILPLSKNQLRRLNWIDQPTGPSSIQRTRFICPTVDILRRYGWIPPTQEGSPVETSESGIVPGGYTILLFTERGHTFCFHHEFLIGRGWRKSPITGRPSPRTTLTSKLLVEFFRTLPRSLLTVKEQIDVGLIPSEN